MTCAACSVSGVLDSGLCLDLPSGLATLRVGAADWPPGTEVCFEELLRPPDLSQHGQVVLTPAVMVHATEKHVSGKRLSFYFNQVDYQGYDPATVNVYQGEDVFAAKGWSAVPASHVLKDAAGRVIGASFKLDYGTAFVLAATA